MSICPRCGELMSRYGGNSFSCECGITMYKHSGGQMTYEDEEGRPYYPNMQYSNKRQREHSEHHKQKEE